MSSTTGFKPGIVIQPIPANAIAATKECGGNALEIESLDGGALTLVLLTFGWSDATDDDAMYGFAENFRARCEETAKSMGLWNRYLYINYSKEDQDPFGGHGENNRERLKRTQKEVSPKGVFTSEGLNRGYFKLP